MRRAIARISLALAGPIVVGMMNVPSIRAQPAATPKFETASVKPCEPAPPGPRRLGVTPGRLRATCMPLNALASIAYGVDLRFPLEGGPAWSRSDGYDIEANAEGNPSAKTMQGPMLQALLEDRFKLKIRRQTRESPVYALTIAKSGFKPHPLDSNLTPLKIAAFPSIP